MSSPNKVSKIEGYIGRSSSVKAKERIAVTCLEHELKETSRSADEDDEESATVDAASTEATREQEAFISTAAYDYKNRRIKRNEVIRSKSGGGGNVIGTKSDESSPDLDLSACLRWFAANKKLKMKTTSVSLFFVPYYILLLVGEERRGEGYNYLFKKKN